jgi:hypothetical protein
VRLRESVARKHHARALLVLASLSGASCSNDCLNRAAFEEKYRLDSFLQGNTHTHTERSFDSSAPVADVLRWYREAGYAFVVITDHDVSAVPGEFFASESPTFIAIAGEEVSSSGFDVYGHTKLVHVNTICSNGSTVGGVTLGSVAAALTDTVQRAVRVGGGIAQINHPTLDDALRAEDVLQAPGADLIEIANRYPTGNSADATYRGTEALWDHVLTTGMRIYGTASDDTHDVTVGSRTPPGQGWVQVAAAENSASSICEALKNGRFYASTGVELTSITVAGARLRLQVQPAPGAKDATYETTFVGAEGETLARVTGLSPSYALVGNETYVRATVKSATEARAWVQPVFVNATCPASEM